MSATPSRLSEAHPLAAYSLSAVLSLADRLLRLTRDLHWDFAFEPFYRQVVVKIATRCVANSTAVHACMLLRMLLWHTGTAVYTDR